MEELTILHWIAFYLLAGLVLALGCASTKVGRNPSWGWGPAIIVIIGWVPLILILIFNPNRYKGK